jgi:hypothetical protein
LRDSIYEAYTTRHIAEEFRSIEAAETLLHDPGHRIEPSMFRTEKRCRPKLKRSFVAKSVASRMPPNTSLANLVASDE